MQGTIKLSNGHKHYVKGGYNANNLNTACFLEVQTKCQGHRISGLLTWVLFYSVSLLFKQPGKSRKCNINFYMPSFSYLWICLKFRDSSCGTEEVAATLFHTNPVEVTSCSPSWRKIKSVGCLFVPESMCIPAINDLTTDVVSEWMWQRGAAEAGELSLEIHAWSMQTHKHNFVCIKTNLSGYSHWRVHSIPS